MIDSRLFLERRDNQGCVGVRCRNLILFYRLNERVTKRWWQCFRRKLVDRSQIVFMAEPIAETERHCFHAASPAKYFESSLFFTNIKCAQLYFLRPLSAVVLSKQRLFEFTGLIPVAGIGKNPKCIVLLCLRNLSFRHP